MGFDCWVISATSATSNVFADAAVETASDPATSGGAADRVSAVWSTEELVHLRAEFDRYDADGDGYIDAANLHAVLESIGAGHVSRLEVEDLLQEFDGDGDGQLDRHEFERIMQGLKTTDDDAAEAFAAIDVDGKGSITPAELLEALVGMGFDHTAASALVGQVAVEGGGGSGGVTVEGFSGLVRQSPALRVKLSVLSRMGALWIKSAGTKYSSNVRHRAVAVLLEDEARRMAAQGGGGHGSGSSGGGHAPAAFDLRPDTIGIKGWVARLCCYPYRYVISRPAVARLLEPAPVTPGQHPHMFPLHRLPVWEQGVVFLHKCRVGVLQYVAVQCFCAIAGFFLQHWYRDFYREGSMSPEHGYFYLAMLKNFSQCWALYCLVYFEHSCMELLKPINPLPKFWS